MLRKKKVLIPEFAPLLNPLNPRVLALPKGRGRRDLPRYASASQAQLALIHRAEEHLAEATRMLRLARLGLVEDLKGRVTCASAPQVS